MIAEYQEQAEQGQAEAQFQLGQVLFHGLGVSIDEDAALIWFHKAADQGYVRARYILGEIYKEGRVTPQDLVQSHMWFSLVARSDDDLATAARGNCELLEEYLTPEQLADAQARTAGDGKGKAEGKVEAEGGG